MANGMFSDLFGNLRREDQDEEQRLQFLAQDPSRAGAYAAYSGASMAGKGLGQAVTGLAGKDPRTNEDRMRDAMKSLGELADADMSTPGGVDAYYKNVIDILRRNGLAGEAHRAAQEWNEYKAKQADQQYKRDDMQRKAEEARRKASVAEEANAIKRLRTQQLAQQGLPEFVQIIERVESQSNPVLRKAMMDRVNQMAGGKIQLEDAGDRVIVRNQRGEILGVDMMGEKPMAAKDRAKDEKQKKALASSYQAAMLAAQTDYKAAADLYNHPGLDDLIGKYSGLAAERTAQPGQTDMVREAAISRLSPAGQEALGLFQQVQGGAFVRALQDLKTAGGGSTGLGQVTEVEGQKITAAKASLFPRQQPSSFRRKLADYISVIEQSAHILGQKAQEEGLDPIELNIVPLTGPTRGVPPVSAPTSPRARTAAPTVDGDRVRVMRPDGATGTIPRAKLEEYKRKGYTEIK